MPLFTNKVVVITGAGAGLGRAYALAFAREGAKIVVNDLGASLDGRGDSRSAADVVVQEIRAAGGVAVPSYDSVATRAGAEGIVGTAVKELGRIDVLVNNAGIVRDKTLLKMTDEMWEPVIEVHLRGTFLCLQAAARAMVEQGTGGCIINTTSVAGLVGNYGQINYGAAKAGIYGMTRVASLELQRHRITVNAVAPIARTRMTESLGRVPEDMQPEHVAPMVLFLASDQAAGITGRVMGVHGRHLFEYKVMTTAGVDGAQDWTPSDIAASLPRIEGSAGAAASAPAAANPAPAAAPASSAPTTVADTPAAKVAEVFRRMPSGFLPEKAGSWKAVMHFNVAGAGVFTVSVSGGSARTAAGADGTPTCIVNTDAETFVGMVEGRIDGQQAYMQGKITANNISDLMKYSSSFSREKAEASASPTPTAPAAAAAASTAPANSPARTSSPARAALPPAEVLPALLDGIGDVLGKRTEAPIELTVETGGAAWRLVWDTNGARSERLGAGSGPSRVVGDPEALVRAIDDPAAASDDFRALRLVATRMADFLQLAAALRQADYRAALARAEANRPVTISPELRTKTIHGAPLVVTREHARAYARATDDDNPAYENGATPPLLVVRYHPELAKAFFTDPGVKVDFLRLVHGEQEMRFLKPVRVGDVLSPKATIEALEHKSRGSLLSLRYRIWRDGELVSEVSSRYLVRRANGAGAKLERAPVEDFGTPDFAVPETVRPDQSRDYAVAALDENPIHLDEALAKAAGHEGIILHGLCTLALASKAIVRQLAGGNPERLASLAGRFARPVLMGDRLTTRGRRLDADGGLERVAFEVVNQDGVAVLTHGLAAIRPI